MLTILLMSTLLTASLVVLAYRTSFIVMPDLAQYAATICAVLHFAVVSMLLSLQDAVWIVGQTPGFRVKVDLSESLPPLQESIRQSQALDTQRSQPDMTPPTPTRAM
ncbi:hypothetical protein [Pseudomonas caspiana]|uniref:hypothetical protein n=1 Tax=Pseudomonas caspiana TaxID=1451454 RepID=UPI0032EE53F9